MTGESEPLPARSPLLEDLFPDLADWRYQITSRRTFDYNCIAWAAGDAMQQWWPIHGYWPAEARRELSVAAFIEAYATLGYVTCEDEAHEPGHDKIAIFASDSGEPLHAARQLDADHWTSKCGDLYDIRHPLKALEGVRYGRVVQFMKRRRE